MMSLMLSYNEIWLSLLSLHLLISFFNNWTCTRAYDMRWHNLTVTLSAKIWISYLIDLIDRSVLLLLFLLNLSFLSMSITEIIPHLLISLIRAAVNMRIDIKMSLTYINNSNSIHAQIIEISQCLLIFRSSLIKLIKKMCQIQ